MEKKKGLYIAAVVLFAVLALTFRPGIWLVHKPANSQNPHYAKGWEDGCISGTNSYSLLYAPLLDKPFVKEQGEPAATADGKPATTDKDGYKSGWNEGFTLCRYYQSAVYELMQFALVIATLLFIGYLISRKKP